MDKQEISMTKKEGNAAVFFQGGLKSVPDTEAAAAEDIESPSSAALATVPVRLPEQKGKVPKLRRVRFVTRAGGSEGHVP